uniref:Heterogeneous nuclear ribonucleoprotein L like n=1 Tax=Sphaeramia orbicularis TaxID=375764 RepID=A0A673B174_9TELE
MMLPFKRQALVEFSAVESADRCVSVERRSPVYIRITRPTNADNPNSGNKVSCCPYRTPSIPITTVNTHSCIFYIKRYTLGRLSSIRMPVTHEADRRCAQKAKAALNGADIYAGCCTLKIEYARPTRLNVIKNDNESWDYTKPTWSDEVRYTTLLTFCLYTSFLCF